MDGIIDFAKKGNVVRFFIGDLQSDYWGDDWDDCPYEHNAGEVYDEYKKGHIDIAFPFDWVVLEPCSGATNSEYSKEDFKNKKVPCIISTKEDDGYWVYDDYEYYVDKKDVYKFYFGDSIDDVIKKFLEIREKGNFEVYKQI